MLKNNKHSLYTINWLEMSIILIINNFFNTAVGYMQYECTSNTKNNIITYKRTYKDSSVTNPAIDIYFNMYGITMVVEDKAIISINVKEYIDKEYDLCKLLPDLITIATEAIDEKRELLQSIKNRLSNTEEELLEQTKPLIEIIDDTENVMYIINEIEIDMRSPEPDGSSFVHLDCNVINHTTSTTLLSVTIANSTVDKIKKGTKVYYINNELLVVDDTIVH